MKKELSFEEIKRLMPGDWVNFYSHFVLHLEKSNKGSILEFDTFWQEFKYYGAGYVLISHRMQLKKAVKIYKKHTKLKNFG